MKILSDEGERRGRFSGFVLTLLVLAAILLVTGFFAARTEGGRSFVERRLEKRLGMPLTVDRTRIGFPYVLVIEGLASEGADSNGPGFTAQEVRVGVGFGPLWRVAVNRCLLRLVRDEDGVWQPAAFARLGGLPGKDVSEISRLTRRLRQDMALQVTGGEIRWRDASSRAATASAGGVSFGLQRAGIPRRKMYHYHLRVYDLHAPDGTRARDLEREWLASEAVPYVELHRSDGGPEQAGQGHAGSEEGEPGSGESYD